MVTTAAWLVRAGRTGGREQRALRDGLLIAGWEELGDISRCRNRHDLRQAVMSAFPDETKSRLDNWIGQLWRLLVEIQENDLVVLPSKSGPTVAVGRVVGPYEFRADEPEGFRHVRAVDWIRKEVPRDAIQQDLLDSMGSLLTICGLKRYGAARRINHIAEHGADPGPTAEEFPRTGVSTSAELLEKAVASSLDKPLRLSIRELLLFWGTARRTQDVVAEIELALAENGLTTRPPFTEGWIDNEIELVPAEDEVGDSKTSEIRRPLPDPADAGSGLRAITLHVGQLQAANHGVTSVQPGDPLTTALTKMLAYNYSQLAVIDEDGELHGAVSWESIGRAYLANRAQVVEDSMVHARVADHNEDLLSQITEIYAKGYVFVRGADRRISGIVTAADLTVRFGDLARPFVLVEEVERRLRRRVDEVLSPEEMGTVRGRKVVSAKELTLGQYKHLLAKVENWERLSWALDHDVFMTLFSEVHQIRNKLMHFSTDPMTARELEPVEGLLRMLRTVDPRA